MAVLALLLTFTLVPAAPAAAETGPADPDAPLSEDLEGVGLDSFALLCLSRGEEDERCAPYLVRDSAGEIIAVQIADQRWGEGAPPPAPVDDGSNDGGCGFSLACRVEAAATSAVEDIAGSIAQFSGEVLANVATLWVSVPVPQLTMRTSSTYFSPGQAGATDGLVQADAAPVNEIARVQDSLRWFVLAIAVLCVLIGAGRIMISARGQELRSMLHGVLLMVGVSTLGLIVFDLLAASSDSFSSWLLGADGPLGADRNFGANLFQMFNGITSAATEPIPGAEAYASSQGATLSLFGLILGGIVLLLLSLVQAILMLGRGAILVVMAVLLPLVAASAITGTGREWLGKYAKWMLALILYKPVASIIYATAFSLLNTDDYEVGDTQAALLNVLMGFTLLGLAVVALPALLRIIAPAAAAVAGGAGGGALLAGVASGAVALAGVGAAAPTGAAAASAGRAGGGATPPSPSGMPSAGAPQGAGDPGRSSQSSGGSSSTPSGGGAGSGGGGSGPGAGPGGGRAPVGSGAAERPAEVAPPVAAVGGSPPDAGGGPVGAGESAQRAYQGFVSGSALGSAAENRVDLDGEGNR